MISTPQFPIGSMANLDAGAPDYAERASAFHEMVGIMAANPNLQFHCGDLLMPLWALYSGWADWYEHAEELV